MSGAWRADGHRGSWARELGQRLTARAGGDYTWTRELKVGVETVGSVGRVDEDEASDRCRRRHGRRRSEVRE